MPIVYRLRFFSFFRNNQCFNQLNRVQTDFCGDRRSSVEILSQHSSLCFVFLILYMSVQCHKISYRLLFSLSLGIALSVQTAPSVGDRSVGYESIVHTNVDQSGRNLYEQERHLELYIWVCVESYYRTVAIWLAATQLGGNKLACRR